MTLTSQYAGTCKVCNKTWKVGNEIWYQKDPKAICIDEQCFERQKAGTTTGVQTGVMAAPTVNYPQPRTESEKTEDACHMIEILWQLAQKKALEVIPLREVQSTEPEEFWHNKDRIILAEVFYKSLTYSWTRP